MTGLVESFTKQQMCSYMDMPGRYGDNLDCSIYSLGPEDYDGTSAILSTVNTDTSQVAGEQIGNSEYEAIISGSSTLPSISWDTSHGQPRIQLVHGAGVADPCRTTIQTIGTRVVDFTKPDVLALAVVVYGLRFSTASAKETNIGLGDYTQTTPWNGAPSIRAGVMSRFFGGSGNTGARAYNSSNTSSYPGANWAASQTNWDYNRFGNSLQGENHMVWVRKTYANADQTSLNWRYESGCWWSNGRDIYSEANDVDSAYDANSVSSISTWTDVQPFITARGHNSPETISFLRMQYWVFTQP